MQGVILAGGLGTRLGPLTEATPKAMVPVRGRPFLEYELDLLREGGVDDLVVCIGHLGKAIMDHFGDGSCWGVRIRYSEDGPGLLGPAGALKKASPLLHDRFLVTYGDAYLRAPYSAVMDTLQETGKLGVMAVYRNDDRYGRSDVAVADGLVAAYDKRGEKRYSWVNYGLTALRKGALELVPAGRAVGEEEFYGALVARKELAAFEVGRRFYEIGNPQSLSEFDAFIGRLTRKTSPRNRTG